MSLSRRTFVRSLMPGAGAVTLIAARGREAWAADAPFGASEDDFQQ
jgi:hypothetical protein